MIGPLMLGDLCHHLFEQFDLFSSISSGFELLFYSVIVRRKVGWHGGILDFASALGAFLILLPTPQVVARAMVEGNVLANGLLDQQFVLQVL